MWSIYFDEKLFVVVELSLENRLKWLFAKKNDLWALESAKIFSGKNEHAGSSNFLHNLYNDINIFEIGRYKLGTFTGSNVGLDI